MMKKKLRHIFGVLIVCTICCGTLHAQNYKDQLTVTSDNDQYVNPNHDRYYTDGVFLNYTHALFIPKKSKLVKKTLEIEFGQRIYNSFTASARRIQPDPFVFTRYGFDRPFTAYLYSGVSLNYFYSNQNALKFKRSGRNYWSWRFG